MNKRISGYGTEPPDDWTLEKIDCLSQRVGSGVTPTGGSNVYKTEGILFIRSQNVRFEGLDLSDVAFIDDRTHRSMAASEALPFDVLLNITGASIGRCCVLPEGLGTANVNQHVCTVRLHEPSLSDAKYLASTLSSPIGQNQIFRLNAGGNREGLNYQQLRAMEVPWPHRDERKKIARILTTLDNLIEKTEALIAKYQSIKQGMMHDLFTRGVDSHGHLRPTPDQAPELYKPSELGLIPKEWEPSKVGNELLAIDAGKSPNCPDQPAPDGEWGVLKVSAVQPDGFRPNENKIIVDRIHVNPAYEVKSGDLLLSRSNTYQLVGIVSLVEDTRTRLMLCDKTLRLRFNQSEARTEFMFWQLQQPAVRRQIEIHATGTSGSMKNISQPSIRGLKFAKPPIDEQKVIAARIMGVQKRIRSESMLNDKLRKQKSGLMQDLLTGKVRVNTLRDSTLES